MNVLNVLTDAFFFVLLAVPGIPMVVFSLECIAATVFGSSRQTLLGEAKRPRIAVLIPAHNEAFGIGATLTDLMPQIQMHDQLIVVADNCEDDTAEVARNQGATVLERVNLQRRGKGYALAHGLDHLEQDPPDVVVIVDADCAVATDVIAKTATLAYQTGRPVQSKYLMEQPVDPSPKDAISALAFLVKNWVRPTGLNLIGMPCPLTGTGMAFPWTVIRHAPIASGNIVEDMQLGLDLAVDGTPPIFCATAEVLGRLPNKEAAATSQRTRWEHGHMKTLLDQGPRLFKEAIAQRRIDLLIMALDLCVPPLSLLVVLWLGVMVILTGLAGFTGQWLPAIILGSIGIFMGIAISMSWYRFGRDQISGKALLTAPLYILWKIPMYIAFIVKPESQWVRTQRD